MDHRTDKQAALDDTGTWILKKLEKRFGEERLGLNTQPLLLNGRYANSVWLGEGGVVNGRGYNPNGSFAVVEVPGQAGVEIQGPNGTATTDKQGKPASKATLEYGNYKCELVLPSEGGDVQCKP